MHTALIITNSPLFPSLISRIELFFNTTNFLRVIIQISNKREKKTLFNNVDKKLISIFCKK
jgi:hypothetical protein